MKLKSLLKVLTATRYDIMAYDEVNGIVSYHKFDYINDFNVRDLLMRDNLCKWGAKVDDICTINGVLNIGVLYTHPDYI